MLTASVVKTDVLHTHTNVSLEMNQVNIVYVRLMFLRIGEIDTLNEKYQAQAAIEARWLVDYNQLSSNLSSDDQRHLADGKSVSLPKYADSHWHPQLFIENALGDLKEQLRYTAKISKEDDKLYVYEQRDVKGLFWEKLELQYFPSDIQDLSISVASMLYNDRVVLVADAYHMSGVNREAFVDQQEWLLYAHVNTQQRFVDEFDFQAADQNEDNEISNAHDRKRSVLTVTCHAARRSSYFYWNGYFLIFLISLISFTFYFIPPHLMVHRIGSSCTLLLTSITFRWTVNRSLPTISYLTTMDIYSIVCIFYLIFNALWHTIIGALVFEYTPNFVSMPNTWLTRWDRGAFYISFSVFILVHVVFFIWLWCVPLRLRQQMKRKDDELLSSKAKQGHGQSTNKKVTDVANYQRIPIE